MSMFMYKFSRDINKGKEVLDKWKKTAKLKMAN